MKNTSYIEKTLEEFEKEFVKKATNWRENHGWTVDYVDSRADKLKSFLTSALQGQAKEMLEAVEKEKCTVPPRPCSKEITITEDYANETILYAGRFNYNKALDDVKEIITNHITQ